MTGAYKKLLSSIFEARELLNGVPDGEPDFGIHHLKLQAFVLLAHAAIEDFLESSAQGLLDETITAYRGSHQVNHSVGCLIVSEVEAQISNAEKRTKSKPFLLEKLPDFVEMARKSHENRLYSNNGIKTSSQNALFKPLGINPVDILGEISGALEAFGVKRGSFAHKFKPKTELRRDMLLVEVDKIVGGLRALDDEIVRLTPKK